MSELRIEIPDSVHKKLKQIALNRGISLKKLVNDALTTHANTKNKKE